MNLDQILQSAPQQPEPAPQMQVEPAHDEPRREEEQALDVQGGK